MTIAAIVLSLLSLALTVYSWPGVEFTRVVTMKRRDPLEWNRGPLPTDLGCSIPPPGWWCSRNPGHDGPCAARRTARHYHLTLHLPHWLHRLLTRRG